LFILAVALPRAEAQDPPPQGADSTLLSIDRIFVSREFVGRGFGQARWIDDGEAYTVLEASKSVPRGRDIVRYGSATGERSVLISAEQLVPKGEKTPLVLENYSWSADRTKLLIFTNSRRVWRQHTRGDYWLLDLRTGLLRKLGRNAPGSSLMFAKFSPDGGRVAYVWGQNIYVQECSTLVVTQLTHDGSRTTINGTFDWVYEEEFGLRDGFRWSPDGRWIAYWQLDASGVRDFLLINNTDSLYSFTIPVQYPKVGETLSACRVGVVAASGGETRWFAPPGDPRNNYIAWMEWAGNASEIAFQYLNRLQNRNELIFADITSGALRTVLVEEDSAWVEVVDDLVWLEGGKRFTWDSEKNGWAQVYLHGRGGEELWRITPGSRDVTRAYRLDGRGEWLYYQASEGSPSQRFLYRASVNNPGTIERLTPTDARGVHTYDVAPNGRWAFHTFSTIDTPPLSELISLPEHRTVRVLADNAQLLSALQRVRRGKTEFFRVETEGGIQLDGFRILPPEFDPGKRYPVLVYVYGEPAGQTVIDSWGGSGGLWHQMLAQKGYIVLSVDNRGTPAPRGREWRKSIYRQIGILASQDQAAAMREIRRWPFVDSTRVAIWGWSGGGSMTLNMLFRYPELYQTGMAVASVPDQRLYDAIYQERYMGLPSGNAEGYRLGSPITYAGNLQGKLLLVHGTGDDNVHYQGAERLINALVAANKQFTMMVYPNRSHGIYEGENTTRHLYTLLTEFLTAHCEPGPR
jgi:dipeptidyl-peptidase-4